MPEQLGGQRNWDYRFCWLRDATLTLIALMGAGYYDEAKAWRDWLRRAVAGTPSDVQIMYGVAGERRLFEREIPWLPGYQGAAPVRIGNAASEQLQLDVFGEIMDALHVARKIGLAHLSTDWSLQCCALEHLAAIWRLPDDGIWEMRGGRKHFTIRRSWLGSHSIDRSGMPRNMALMRRSRAGGRESATKSIAWFANRAMIESAETFTQSFGSPELDASLLLIPDVGFLPIDDPRVAGTIAAVERELCVDGFVLRYRTESGADGLPSGEGVFLPCSFWLIDVYQKQGRDAEAHAMLDRLLALRNDLGLLSEEYDVIAARQVGNFPQAFSHLSLVRTVLSLDRRKPIRDRLGIPTIDENVK